MPPKPKPKRIRQNISLSDETRIMLEEISRKFDLNMSSTLTRLIREKHDQYMALNLPLKGIPEE